MKIFDLKNIQFHQIISDVSSYLTKLTGSFQTINKNTVFGQIITVVAGIAHNIMLYIEDSLTEQNKYTAQRKKSVMGLAAMSGYQPSYGKAAAAWVRIAHKPNNRKPLDIILENHTQIISTQTGLYYNLILNSPAMLIKCDTNISNEYLYAVQGTFEKQMFTVPGGKLYRQNVKYAGYLDADYVEVKVNGEPWTKKASLYDMGADETAYELRYCPTSGFDLIFGTDVNGRALKEGDIIEVSYLIHAGESGNIDTKEAGSFVFATFLNDISGAEVDVNSCLRIDYASDDAIASGADPESIEHARNMIGFNSRSMVLSDSNAYKAFLNRFSFVGYNRTWSDPGSLVVNSMVMRNYNHNLKSGKDYFNLTEDDFNLTDIQKASIKNAIVASGQQLAGTTYNIIDIELCKYVCYMYIKLKDNSTDHDMISNKIQELVGKFFGDIVSDSYVPKSDLINLIKENVDSVDGVTCYFLSQRNEEAIINNYYYDRQKLYDPVTGTYRTKEIRVSLRRGENPSLGLDAHGNIVIDANDQFPVLMGGWSFLNKQNNMVVTQPLTIIFE